jgi:hypothetical protein
MFSKMGKQQETFNILTTINPKNKSSSNDGIKNIVFVAHHDTKSQKVTTLIRTISYVLGFMIGLVLGLLIIISSILKLAGFSPVELVGLKGTIIVLFCVVSIFLAILMYNKTIEGKSVGSLDNATAMAIVFKLLEYYKNNPIDSVKLWFLITGAEEFGMVGAIHFWQKYAREKGDLNSNDTVVFNYDLVAQGLHIVEYHGLPKRKPYNKYMNEIFKKSAKELNIPVSGFWLPMLGTTDGWIFRTNKVETIDVINEGMSKYAHSGKDNPSVCDLKTLKDAVAVTKLSVEKLVSKNG